MRLTSQNQTIGNFFIGKDRILDISAVPEVTRARQLLQIPPWQEYASYLVLKRHQEQSVFVTFQKSLVIYHDGDFE
jgi:hypothetical protein